MYLAEFEARPGLLARMYLKCIWPEAKYKCIWLYLQAPAPYFPSRPDSQMPRGGPGPPAQYNFITSRRT